MVREEQEGWREATLERSKVAERREVMVGEMRCREQMMNRRDDREKRDSREEKLREESSDGEKRGDGEERGDGDTTRIVSF